MLRRALFHIGVYILAFTFLTSGLSKIADFNNYFISMSKSPILFDYVKPFSVLLIVIELSTALLLLTRRLLKIGVFLAFFLALSFTTYLTTLIAFHNEIHCSCGGIFNTVSPNTHYFMNLMLCVVATYCAVNVDKTA